MAVLGNHDNWDSHEAWSDAFNNSSISLLENQVATVRVNGMDICIRGLGDFYSGYHAPTQIPRKCEGITLTLTHDPQGLLVETGELSTISFAGHTHCGQIAFPIIGAPIVPTSALQGYPLRSIRHRSHWNYIRRIRNFHYPNTFWSKYRARVGTHSDTTLGVIQRSV